MKEDPKDKRMSWQKPNLVIAALGDISDKTIVDLGAGIGYFTFKLLPKAKKVIAVDIDQEKINVLNSFKNSLSDTTKSKIEVRLADAQNPNLKENEADLILIVNTVAYIEPRVEYFRNLRKSLTENGKLFIVDYKTKRLPDYTVAPDFSQRLYLHVLEEQLEQAGYTNIKTDDTSLDFQYMVSCDVNRENLSDE